jgi:flagellar FliJ protein
MTSLQPLNALLAQSERQRDLAVSEQLRLQVAHEAAQAQSEQLLQYRREYEQRWGREFGREGAIELVRCYQGFMERLTQAVEQQARIAQHSAAQLERATQAVREQEIHVASVRKLIERRLQEARVSAERQEQRQSDEFAARVVWQRRSSASNAA